MASSINDFRRSKLFRAAIIVPTVIALIFSIFNLTAPNDPEKISSNFKLGIVNLDTSTSFPLVSTQAIKQSQDPFLLELDYSKILKQQRRLYLTEKSLR
jgi:hypothetical protein